MAAEDTLCLGCNCVGVWNSIVFYMNRAAKKRMEDIQKDPSIGKSEEELDDYLRKRGVSVD